MKRQLVNKITPEKEEEKVSYERILNNDEEEATSYRQNDFVSVKNKAHLHTAS